MRILYLTAGINHQSDSLTGHITHALARMAQREGHQVHVATPPVNWPDQQTVNDENSGPQDHHYLLRGVSVTQLAPLHPEAATATFGKWVREQEYDVLHGVFFHPDDWPFAPPAESLPPLVITLTGLPAAESCAIGFEGRQWMSCADLCVVPSVYAVSQWHNILPNLSLRVMPHGVDLLALIQARQVQIRDTTPQSPPTLLCVGTFDQRSGLLDVLKAFATLGRVDMCLHLFGGLDVNSAYGRSVMEAVGSDRRVCYVSTQRPTSLTAIAQPFDAVCLPGLGRQPFSLLAQECAALGVPCFMSRSGPHEDPLDKQVGLHLVPVDDPSAWAMVMESWVNQFDRSQFQPMDAAVPLRIEEEAFLYEGFYRSLIFNRSR